METQERSIHDEANESKGDSNNINAIQQRDGFLFNNAIAFCRRIRFLAFGVSVAAVTSFF